MFQRGNYFPTISKGFKIFRNVELGVIILKQMIFPLQKNELK